MSHSATVASLALIALLGGSIHASAQDKIDGKIDGQIKEELKKVDPVPPATGKSPPEQAGTQEPSTKVKGVDSSAPVFVDGRLAVPGAPADTQTVPSKYSSRNAEIDKLPTVAFRLLYLADAQKQEIYGQLHAGQGGLALSPAYAKVGAEIPADIALRNVKPTPDSIGAKFTQLRGTRYLIEGPHVLLLDTNHVVIGVLSPQ